MAYVPPAEETVIVCGGLTTATGHVDNGGGATKAAWDANSPSDFMGAGGTPLGSYTNVSYTHSTLTLAKTGIGTDVIVGTLAYVEEVSTSSSGITTGRYKITARGNDYITIGEVQSTGNSTNMYVRVGGAIAYSEIHQIASYPVNDPADYNRFVYYNRPSQTFYSGRMNVEDFDGTPSSKLTIIGYNLALTEEAMVTIAPSENMGNGIVVLKSTYVHLKNFNINGGGSGNNLAGYCVQAFSDCDYLTMENCNLYGAYNAGAYIKANDSQLINVNIYDNGGNGLQTNDDTANNSIFFNCMSYNNGGDGFMTKGANQTWLNCISHSNGGNGWTLTEYAFKIFMTNCLSYNNDDDGCYITTGTAEYCNRAIFKNNSFVGNGGYGVAFNGELPRIFSHNHSYNNTSGHTDDYDDGDWADLFSGNNFSGDPSFTSTASGSENFLPTTDSPLIDAGQQLTGYTTWDVGPIQGVTGSVGGCNLLQGLLS